MRQRTRLVTRGFGTAAVIGVALVLLVASGGVGGARAVHSSCGDYCWYVTAPYNGVSWANTSSSGAGSFTYDVQSSPVTGIMESYQQSVATAAEQEIGYALPTIMGDPIDFYTAVDVLYTFTTFVIAGYSVGGSCVLDGEWEGVVSVSVIARISGPMSYSTEAPVFTYDTSGGCVFSSPHGNGSASPTESPDGSGEYGMVVTQTLNVYLPAGIYTPVVETVAETYAEALGISSVTSTLNMETGGFYSEWDSVEINWGPGE
jgi:hypothetical protein